MKELLLVDGHMQLADAPEPQIDNSREVKVRIAYSAICGFDVNAYTSKITLRSKRGQLGHEVSGYVVAVGSEVTRFSVGDRVTINPLTPCMACEYCLQGRYNLCEHSVHHYSTLMREFVVVQETQVYAIPPSVSMQVASFSETLASAMYTVERAHVETGGYVILLGCGGFGQIILLLAKRYPSVRVAVVEPDADKRALALEMGADVVWNPDEVNILEEGMRLTGNRGFDKVIESSGNEGAAQTAIHLLARGGCLVYAALYGVPFSLEVNLLELYYKDSQIHGLFVTPVNYYDVVQALPSLPLERVITAVYPVEEAEEAFKSKAAGKNAKVILDWHPEIDGFSVEM